MALTKRVSGYIRSGQPITIVGTKWKLTNVTFGELLTSSGVSEIPDPSNVAKDPTTHP